MIGGMLLIKRQKMRMNFIMIHNYNGFCGHNETFHNFEYNGYLSRGWMPTIKTGHGWLCPGWDINEYRFWSLLKFMMIMILEQIMDFIMRH